MAYFSPEVIKQVKKIDLLTYLRNYEPDELDRFSGDTWTTKTHDSLKISNGVWCWFSRGSGGRSALDYLVKVKGYSFLGAVEQLTGQAASRPPVFASSPKKEVGRKLLLPEKSPTTDRVEAYLTARGIDEKIVQNCIRRGLIYESLPMHNAVIVGHDEEGIPRYAAFRSTGDTRFLGDTTGSDKRYSFRLLSACRPNVHLFESSIDLLSYATIMKMQGHDWQQANFLSLAGVYQPKQELAQSKVPVALALFLETHPEVKEVVLHLDNDRAGRLASEALKMVLPKEYEIKDSPPPGSKDVNDWLCKNQGLSRPKQAIERAAR